VIQAVRSGRERRGERDKGPTARNGPRLTGSPLAWLRSIRPVAS